MSKYLKLLSRLLIMLPLILASIGLPAPVQALATVQFYDLEIENHFPDQLIFRARVSSSGAEIVEAEFASTTNNIYSPPSYYIEPVEITSGADVILEYTLDTSDITTPPLMSYSYRWQVELADGTKITSEDYSYQYLDNRYEWQVLENDQVGVWWHDRPSSFGQSIFEISTESINLQEALFLSDLENQILVVINNSEEEFASWHHIAHDWVGGETFSNYGITVQIVDEFDSGTAWLYNVIPHEISHIFFDQVTYNPTVSIPVWFNEGLAQFNELTSNDWAHEQVRSAASEGRLVALSALENGFGAYDTERIYLSYYESLSAVSYLVDTYGTEGLSALLAAYREGNPTNEAFQTALGVSATQFELDWADSLGAVNYVISTPWPSPTFRPPPTFGTSSGGATPQPAADQRTGNPLIPCMSIISLLGFGFAGVWIKKYQHQEK